MRQNEESKKTGAQIKSIQWEKDFLLKKRCGNNWIKLELLDKHMGGGKSTNVIHKKYLCLDHRP